MTAATAFRRAAAPWLLGWARQWTAGRLPRIDATARRPASAADDLWRELRHLDARTWRDLGGPGEPPCRR